MLIVFVSNCACYLYCMSITPEGKMSEHLVGASYCKPCRFVQSCSLSELLHNNDPPVTPSGRPLTSILVDVAPDREAEKDVMEPSVLRVAVDGQTCQFSNYSTKGENKLTN